MSKALRRSLPIATAILAAISVSQTALGYVETKTTGTTGAHSYTDTSTHQGVICTYKETTGGDQKLKRMYVTAPKIKAIPGMGMEKVGFQFMIQRQIVGFSTGKWKTIYTSDIATAVTNSSTNANIGDGSANVTVPYAPGADASANFRAKVKMFWYAKNGTTVIGSASGRLEWYVGYVGIDSYPHEGYCYDYMT